MNRNLLFYTSIIMLMVTFLMFSLSGIYVFKSPSSFSSITEGSVLMFLFFTSSLLLTINSRRGKFGHLLFVGCILLFNGYGYNLINDLFLIIDNVIVGWISAIIKIVGYGFILFASIELYLEITSSLNAIKKENVKLKKSVFVDGLSGLYNRKYLDEFLLSKDFIENKEQYKIIIVDIDDFKSVNDTYGHTIGDKVIELCGEGILSSLREDSIGIRYGGEEFVIISKCCNGISEKIAKRISRRFKKDTLELSQIKGRKTLSMGISAFKDNKEFFETFDEADKALYDAKNSGKNKYIVFK
jgi:diguanylate cyclase (GGDEF)-like protein